MYMQPSNILLLENDEKWRDYISRVLDKDKFIIEPAIDLESALKFMRINIYDLIIFSADLPCSNDMEALTCIKNANPGCDLIITTSASNVNSAIDAMKEGVYDFLVKPLNPELTKIIINKAIEKRILHKKAVEAEYYKNLSRKDGLTEVYNYRFFNQLLETEISRATRYNKEIALMMVDLDNFKEINDIEGHQAGDRILKHVANILIKSTRDCDQIARYGGDEFTIIMPETKKDSCLPIANRIKKEISRYKLELKNLHSFHLTLSIGVSGFPEDGETRPELIKKADKALYFAKSSGKNTIKIYSNDCEKIPENKEQSDK
ncbi:MAG: diguanylate cyclase [Candidatus Schekmanbacteria bacterium]|nr:diguanylate cyclase [Candidatus Schekmanbacteria bacterium]